MAKATHLPWVAHDQDDNTVCTIGGDVSRFTAGGTLLTGDVVVMTAANTVNKSATQADATFFAGFVVGGDSMIAREIFDIIDQRNSMALASLTGIQAATVGQNVLVQVSGIALAVAGAAIAAIPANSRQMLDTGTAGRVIPGTTAGQQVGTALITAAGNGSVITILIDHR